MTHDGTFPPWLEGSLLDDQDFAAAYDAVPAEMRAWIKKGLAGVHARFGHVRQQRSLARTEWNGGSRTLELAEPLAWGLVALPSVASPARLAAAAAPLLLAGVEEALAVLPGGGIPSPAALAALELSGLESAATLDDKALRRLARHLGETARPGVVLDLRGLDAGLCAAFRDAGARLWSAPGCAKAGIWSADGVAWDYQALAWAHPDVEFTVLGAATEALPAGFRAAEGGLEDLLAAGHDFLCLPPDLAPQGLESAALVVLPGCEGCWLWPDLSPGLFRSNRVAIG
jgi:hypothetical protein